MNTEAPLTWDILPHLGVGVVRFGQTRSEVRSLLGDPSRVFRKGFADTLTDAYMGLGMHFFYDPEDRLESVGSSRQPLFASRGCRFWAFRPTTLCRRAQRGYKRGGYEDEPYVFENAGFSLYVVEGVVKAVEVFARGCHDTTNPNSQRSRAASGRGMGAHATVETGTQLALGKSGTVSWSRDLIRDQGPYLGSVSGVRADRR